MVIPMYERTKDRSLTGNKAVATVCLFWCAKNQRELTHAKANTSVT